MKRMFLSMLAAVTLFASCSQEEVVSQQQATGEESLVSFTLITPELGSRAAATEFNGDGKLATDLYYAVYDETIGEIVEPISVKGTEPVEIEVGTPETIQLPLLNGHKYSLIFWAENEGCPYTVNWDEKAITLDNNGTGLKNNQEVYDAFYAYYPTFTVTGHKTENIELKRPFAQLNIATSEGDLERVVKYYYGDDATKAIASTQIVVTTPTAMDLTTGNAYDEQELIYTMETYGELKPETGLFPATVDPTIDGVYKAISLNYLLVSAEKQLVDIKMSCNSGVELDKEFKNVPVQRNYRTNIYGNIYTSQSDWTVEIKPEFGGENDLEVVAVATEAELTAAITKGGLITLADDITISETMNIPADKNVTINLNGKILTNKVDNTNTDVLTVAAGGTLIIDGEGTVEAVTGNDGYAVISDGTLIINGGTFKSGVDANGEANAVIYARGNGKIYVNGGTFPNDSDSKYVLNKKDQDRATTVIEVTGGKFQNFNPGDNAAEGTGTNFLADGYTVKKDGDYYEVVDYTEVFTGADDVAMLSDVKVDATVTVGADNTIDGQGHEIAVEETDDLSTMLTSSTLRFIQTQGNATFKDLVIDGNNASYDGYGIRGIFLTGAGTVTIENVTIKNVTYTINDDSATKTVKVKNSTLEGWTSYNPNTTGEFENVNFTKGTYATFRPHGTTTLTDCSFEEGFVLLLDKLADGKTVTIKNCTYNGAAITLANIADLAEGYENGDIIIQ